MQFTLKGTLCALLCKTIEVPIGNASVRLYRPGHEEVVRATAARPKETFHLLDPKEVEAKDDRLVAEGRTDDDGRFAIDIEDDADYDGEAVEVDLSLTGIDGHEIDPIQVTVTTIQPRWRKTEEGAVAEWDHCLSATQWCAILEAADLWVVAGHVTDCETEEPLSGLDVTAFDADLIQDDELGTATTAAGGAYVIYYATADIERVPLPFTPVELIGGPDLYFRIDSAGGTPLLEEDRSRGRDGDRENVGHCHCEDLCVDFRPDDGEDGDPPLFTHVGVFNIFQDVDPDGTLNKARYGRGGDGWGFFGNVTLEGYVPEHRPGTGERMWYRFLYRDADGDEHPLVGDLVSRVAVGGRLVPTGSGPFGLGWQEVHVAGQPITPDPSLDPAPEILIPTSGSTSPVENGWVRVPNLHGGGVGHGPLLRFDTTSAVPGGPLGSVTPGSAPSSPREGDQVTVIFETTVDDGSGNPSTASGDISRQAETVTLHVNNFDEVRALDVVDDAGNPIGCDITDGATVRYTADHEFLHSYSVSLNSPAAGGGSSWPTDLAQGNQNRAGNPPGTNRGVAAGIDLVAEYDGSGPFDAFADWPSCSYIARLTARRSLTNGRHDDDGDTTPAVDGVFYKS